MSVNCKKCEGDDSDLVCVHDAPCCPNAYVPLPKYSPPPHSMGIDGEPVFHHHGAYCDHDPCLGHGSRGCNIAPPKMRLQSRIQPRRKKEGNAT